MRLDRRAWLRLVGASGAALAVGGCGDDLAPGATDVAVALLEPTADAVLVAVWARFATEVVVEIVDTGAGTLRHATLAIDATGSGVLDLTSLAPGARCEISILSDGLRLGPYHARTAPAADDPRPVRVALVADYDPVPEFDTELVGQLAAAAPELVISLGDFPYTDNGPPAMTVETYRERHVAARTHPRLRALHALAPMVAIYDDHEFRNNWDAMFAAAEGERYAAAMQVWDELFPRRAAPGPTAEPGDVRYRQLRWGAHLECFVLDCRRFRSANAMPDGPDKTMLGAAQLAWICAAVPRSTATYKLVLTSVPLDFGTGVDHWVGFRHERQLLFDALLDVPGVVFASADQHWFAAHRHAYGIREFQVGPLARGIATPGPVVPGVVFRALTYNVGLLDASAEALTITGLGPDGAFYSETLTAAQLTPRRDRSAYTRAR